MSELAFNYQGERFILPAEAAHWRVRRIRDGQRGQLDVVRDAEGVPLVLPIEITHDGFRAAVGDQDGRYRLDALNAEKLPIDVPAAYVTVPAPRRPAAPMARTEPVDATAPRATVTAPFGTWPALPMPSAMTGTEYLLAEALRGQVAMFQTLAVALSDRMAANANGASQMIGAAAELVRAADGAAMPRRKPEPLALPAPVVIGAPMPEPRNASQYMSSDYDPDGDDGDEPATAPVKDEMDGMIEKLGKVMTAVGPAVPHIVALVRGYPPADGGLRNAAPVEPKSEDHAEGELEPAPAVTHAMASHMVLVHQELGEDGPLFRRMLQRMEPDERRALVAHLCSMTLDEAVDAAAVQLAAIRVRASRRMRAQRASRQETAAFETPMARHERRAEPDGGDCETPDDRSPRGAHDLQEHTDRDDSDRGDADAEDPADRADADSDVEVVQDGIDPDAAPCLGSDASALAPVSEQAARPDAAATTPTPSAQSLTRANRATVPPASSPVASSLDAHMMKIAQHLTLPEVLQARAMVGNLTAGERAAWIKRLTALAPAEAAQVVRAELARRADR